MPITFVQPQHRRRAGDRERAMAEILAQGQGGDAMGQGLNKAAAMLWGMAADNKDRAAEQATAKTLADALKAGMGTPAMPGPTLDGSAGYGGRPGDKAEMVRILSGNPETAPYALSYQMGAEEKQGERDWWKEQQGVQSQARREESAEERAWREQQAAEDRAFRERMQQAQFGQQSELARLTASLKGSSGENTPASIREWEAFQGMSPEQKAQYLVMKRANPYLNLGNEMVQPNPVMPGQAMGGFAVGTKPEVQVDTKTGQVIQVPGMPGGAPVGQGAPGQMPAGPTVTDLPANRGEREAAQKAVQAGEYTSKLIDDLVKHPGFETVVGAPGPTGMLTAIGMAPGTDAADFRAIHGQLSGRQFLEAYETLKGGGAITEVEGKKAAEAISRLTNLGQSEDAYRQAAEELKGIIAQGRARAKAKLGGAPAAPPAGGGWSITEVK